MNPEEVFNEIENDWDILSDNLIDRLSKSYHTERMKLKINKLDTYPKAYSVKSKNKNTWIFILSKAPSKRIYKGTDSVNICCLIYYYHELGIRVFKKIPQGDWSVYNAHVFTRYNERLELNIDSTLDKVISFFTENGYILVQIIKKEGASQLCVGK